ncbi:MAG: signal peptide peptidase SppA [Alphaproteobacteria bacterium]|nr:signal peptide peptidase SppA [Alphaproteobacteria bacterium]
MASKKSTRLLLWITALGMLILIATGVAVGLLVYDDTPSVAEGAWLEVRISGSMPDGPLPDSFVLDPEQIPLTLHEYAALLHRAAEDEDIGGVFLDLDSVSMSMAAVQELRGGLAAVREAGKPCWTWSKVYDNKAWYLASACDQIMMHPQGVPMVIGLSMTTEHYAGTFEKVGVQADYERVGTYKSAVETYEAIEPSEPSKEMYGAMLDSVFDTFITDAAVGRGLSEDALRALINDPPITAGSALEKGMVDRLAYRDELRNDDDQLVISEDETADLVDLQDYARGLRSDWRGGDKVVAVVHLQGAIVDGKSTGGGFGGSAVVGDRSVVPMLEKLAEDEDVVAVVLRINSPGGSALASDVIWRAVDKLNEEKPVVVSMGGAAASGGYYIAMAGRHIVAQPATLTGSIGVFAGKFAIDGLLEKVGITTWTTQRGDLAGLLSSPAPFTDAERAKLRERIEDFYATFLAKAAEGRGMTVEEVDAVAQGRVWTGAQALEVGLVDELGGLELAVQRAVELAELDEDVEVGRRMLPRRSTFLEALTESLNQQTAAPIKEALSAQLLPAPTLPAAVTERLDGAALLQRVLDAGGLAAFEPVRISVH